MSDWTRRPSAKATTATARAAIEASPSGALSRLGDALREPHGRVHFAGAERGSWPNNMEGAIESGCRSTTAIQTAS